MINRRAMLACIGLGMMFPVTGNSGEQDDFGDYADPKSADDWMLKWISDEEKRRPYLQKAPRGALHMGRFADPFYYLVNTIGWDPEVSQARRYQPVRVPIGFVTDFASIPRVFWSILRPDGMYSYAAIIHDYLYWEQFLSREISDEILKMCMEDFKVDSSTVATIYAGVRIGGKFAWDENSRLRAAGEKRVLKLFPTDPTVRWSEWKIRSDVFYS